ncbi:hypothetical protein H4683_004153 [Filibacter limicola]|uniref:Uncharacterized protein n=1 Tax=Sporosarcina limicola TaxID=34101 RepID=A0A927RF83_9BACL|nr:hypothetical protein [Sporosarcina limicola]
MILVRCRVVGGCSIPPKDNKSAAPYSIFHAHKIYHIPYSVYNISPNGTDAVGGTHHILTPQFCCQLPQSDTPTLGLTPSFI